MKNLLLLIFLFQIPFVAQSQNRSIKNFYHKYKKTEGTRNAVIPGFLIWLATGIANESIGDEPEAKIALKFAKKFKTMRFLVMEDENHVTQEDFQKLMSGAKKANYEELISVKRNGEYIQILGRGKNDKLKNLLVLVSAEDSFMMMSMKTKIKTKHLNRLINDLIKLDKVQKKIKKKEQEALPPPLPTEEKKEVKKKAKARA